MSLFSNEKSQSYKGSTIIIKYAFRRMQPVEPRIAEGNLEKIMYSKQ